jgi:hypothetical protein
MLMADSTRVHQICLRRGFKLVIFVTQVGMWGRREAAQPASHKLDSSPKSSRSGLGWRAALEITLA